DSDGSHVAGTAQRRPLLEKCELDHPLPLQFRGKLAAHAIERFRIPMRQLTRLAIPALAMVVLLKHVVENEVFQPPRSLGAKRVIASAIFGAAMLQKFFGCLLQ